MPQRRPAGAGKCLFHDYKHHVDANGMIFPQEVLAHWSARQNGKCIRCTCWGPKHSATVALPSAAAESTPREAIERAEANIDTTGLQLAEGERGALLAAVRRRCL